MKLLIVTPHFYPAVGGLESYVLSLVRGLKKRGHEIVIVTSSTEHRVVTKSLFENNTIYYLPVQFRVSNTPIGLLWHWQLKKIFAAERPDIINTHSPVPFLADVATYAAGHIPVVATYHAGSLLKGSGLVDIILQLYERVVLPRVFRRARHIAAVYPAFVKRVVGKDSAHKVTFTPPGIDTEFFVPRDVKKTHDLIYAGRIESTSSWKGIEVLLEAVHLLKVTHPHITLQIVGDGDAVDLYRRQAEELGISGHVTFTGIKKDAALVEAFQKSRVIVLPSKTEAESFGMVLAEAASCGVPGVGSRVGGIPNVIEHGTTGLLATPDDIESLADAIATLLDDPIVCDAYGQAARQRIVGLYSVKALIDRMENILISAHKRPKIIHVVAHFPPSLGGMERVAENVAIELARRGETVEVVTSDIGYQPTYHDHQQPGYTVTRLRGWMIANLPVIPGLLLHLLHQPRQSLYHIHVAQAGLPELSLLAAWLRRGKTIAHFHLDVVASGTFGVVFKIYKATLFPWMLRHMDAVIVFSNDQKELVCTKYGVNPESVHIIPNGVGLDYFLEAPRTAHAPLRLLFVGRLSPQKNLSFLLESLDTISDTFMTTIVGTGDQAASLKAQVEELKLQNVHFAGRKDGDALIKAYREADVFVLPSEREGMPLVLLEAMAMRLPVIGNDVLGIRDHVLDGKNGYLVPLGNATAFRKILLKLAHNPKDYGRLSDGAAQYVSEFSWPRLVEHITREVY